jgi:hypothetical protein
MKITGRTAGCSDVGKGFYAIYIYDYNTLKAKMDDLYDASNQTNQYFKFNDPLSTDPALQNENWLIP